MCLYVLTVLWCALRFPRIKDAFSNPPPVVFLIRSRNWFPFASTWIHRIFVGSVLLMFLVLCVVFMSCLSLSCILYPMLPVFLDCPFLIASSNFGNVYYTHLSMFIYFENFPINICCTWFKRHTWGVVMHFTNTPSLCLIIVHLIFITQIPARPIGSAVPYNGDSGYYFCLTSLSPRALLMKL